MEVRSIDDKFNKFTKTLEKPTIGKLLRMINLLEEFGNELGMPHSKKINRNLFELRILGQQNVRVLYTFRSDKIFLLHGFLKKSQKISTKEIALAERKLRTLDTL